MSRAKTLGATPAAAIALLMPMAAFAQPAGLPRAPLPQEPVVVATVNGPVRVVPIVTGLSHPWGMAFLPNGDILVTEREGRVRLIRDGVLDPEPIAGVPAVHAVRLSGLMDIALHPEFERNGLVYLTYTKNVQQEPLEVSTTLARGRLEGHALVGMQDILNADTWPGNGGSASRIVFGPDGYLYMTTGASNGPFAQEPGNLRGKVLRLRDDGTPAPGNPFAGQEAYRPEIFSLGHRNQLGLAFNPQTGDIWNSEMGPNGGDEVNIILPGRNYGWPLASHGRTYEGPPVSEVPWREGIELPWAHWVPGISPSGLSFYTGDRYFPSWNMSVFIGALRMGQIQGTGHLARIEFDENGNERRRELLLTPLGQRIRDVRQGPDGYLYLLTDEDDAALLRLEPAE
ncbi:MAG TPA: PQQ-dependent sugar dehydrogenase [Gammaproteobacteria bacterium]|nr:PQQ-dependent sugar dehydrogenase [Gammaproteobacteria bacterium]